MAPSPCSQPVRSKRPGPRLALSLPVECSGVPVVRGSRRKRGLALSLASGDAAPARSSCADAVPSTPIALVSCELLEQHLFSGTAPAYSKQLQTPWGAATVATATESEASSASSSLPMPSCEVLEHHFFSGKAQTPWGAATKEAVADSEPSSSELSSSSSFPMPFEEAAAVFKEAFTESEASASSSSLPVASLVHSFAEAGLSTPMEWACPIDCCMQPLELGLNRHFFTEGGDASDASIGEGRLFLKEDASGASTDEGESSQGVVEVTSDKAAQHPPWRKVHRIFGHELVLYYPVTHGLYNLQQRANRSALTVKGDASASEGVVEVASDQTSQNVPWRKVHRIFGHELVLHCPVTKCMYNLQQGGDRRALSACEDACWHQPSGQTPPHTALN